MATLRSIPRMRFPLFHSRCGGFPLRLCSYALLDAEGVETPDPAQVATVRVTASNGERFRLRDPAEIRRFLTAVQGVRPAQLAQLDAAAQDLRSLNAPIRATDDQIELGDALADPTAGPEERAVATILRRDLAAALRRCLTDRERRVLVAAMGLDGGPPQPLEAIGATEGFSRERARQLLAGALAKLRDDPVIAGYREMAGEH